ncbi:MAG: TPM domain-containing protein [Flavobacteriales bacterium]|nr:TPM domain-containing protein [Flavobacteriales bacterium]
MRKYFLFFILAMLLGSAKATIYYSPSDVPDPKSYGDGFVSDPDGYLSSYEIDQLNEIITRMRDEKGFEVAVVVVSSIDQKEVLPFATKLINLWGVGKGDRGILILAAISDRNLAIGTGYETEKFIPDLVTQEIQQEEIIPYFKLEEYGKGLIAGVEVLSAIVMEEDVPDYVAEAQQRSKNLLIWEYIAMGLGVLILIITIVISPNLKTIFTSLIIIVASVVVSFLAYLFFLKESHLMDVIRDGAVILSFIGLAVNAFITAKDETEKIWPYAVLITCAVGAPLSGLYLYGYHAIVYFYLAGAGILFAFFLITYLSTLAINDPYQKYQTLRTFKLDVFAYIFPFPMYVVDMVVENLLENWRNQVRFSKKTGLEMHKLDEEKDNKYLEKGQITEEKVKSVDYDVWVSGEPDDILILKYTAWFTKYSSCDKCHYKTWYLEYDRTISAATYSSSGTGERKKSCAHCSHQTVTRYTIPKLTPPSSSSSSSGGGYSSSSGGGSWGGGSSGGGGSSSSW